MSLNGLFAGQGSHWWKTLVGASVLPGLAFFGLVMATQLEPETVVVTTAERSSAAAAVLAPSDEVLALSIRADGFASPAGSPSNPVGLKSTPTPTTQPAATATAVPPTAVPATAVPPTAVPPTAVPPTTVPPTTVPPTTVPPTAVPPTAVPPTAVPPAAVPPTTVPPTVVPPTTAPAPPPATPIPPPPVAAAPAALSVPVPPVVAPTVAPVQVAAVARSGPPGVISQIPGSAFRWLDAYGWRVDWRQGPGPGRIAEAQYATNTIVIWYDTARSDAIWAGAFAHELGHAVSYVHFGNQQMSDWNAMRGLSSWRWVPGTPNDFGVGEGDFAEAFMSYILGHRVRSDGGPLTSAQRAWISANTPF